MPKVKVVFNSSKKQEMSKRQLAGEATEMLT